MAKKYLKIAGILAVLAAQFGGLMGQAQTTGYVYSHGLRGNPGAFNNIDAYLSQNVPNKAPKPSGQTLWDDQYTTTNSLITQGFHLANNMYTAAFQVGSNGKLILFSHSQGTLRAREYLQHTANDPFYQPSRQTLKGLVLLGSPSQGAPLAINAPGLVSEVAYNLSRVCYYGTLVGACPSYVAFGGYFINVPNALWALSQMPEVAGYLLAGQSYNEMKPGSTLITNMNGYTSCYWVNWSGWWFQICNRQYSNGYVGIGNTATLSVVGQNSSVDSLLANWGLTPQLKSDIRSQLFTVQGILVALAPATLCWTCSGIQGAGNLIYLIDNLQSRWNQVVGNTAHDGLIPEYSQNVRDLGVVSCPNFNRLQNLQYATHFAEFDIAQYNAAARQELINLHNFVRLNSSCN